MKTMTKYELKKAILDHESYYGVIGREGSNSYADRDKELSKMKKFDLIETYTSDTGYRPE